MKRFTLALCLAFTAHIIGLASSPDNSSFFPLDQVRAGMKGYGLTVFKGSKPERFDVEVLGVLKGTPNPRQSSVIVRVSGTQIDYTGVFAGMSGSPVYIEDKLLGAIAFTFAFSKEPLAGVTPIVSMVENVETGNTPQPSAQRHVSFKTLVAANAGFDLPNISSLGIDEIPGLLPHTESMESALVPIATPVSFSGVPQSVLDLFASDFRKIGIQPTSGVGSASTLSGLAPANPDTLQPGSSVTVQLTRGDFSIDAAGTVTYRDGDRIYAFGHPFLGSGETSWPMSESSVITVVPNLNNSFKISSTGNMVGSISQDRASGVLGKLGEQPKMVPVKFTVNTSRKRTETYNFEVISDPLLTPLLMRIASLSALVATERQIGNHTVVLKGKVMLVGQPDVVLDNTFSMPNGAAIYAVASIERPIALLMNSGFNTLDIKGIEIEISSVDKRSSGTLSRVCIDKTEIRCGETIEMQAFARNDNGSEYVERIPLKIPIDAPAGPLVILIADGATISLTEVRSQGPDSIPRDLGQLVRTINKIKKNYRLYIKVLRPGGGAIVNNEEMPALPPSVLATLGSQRTSGAYTPISMATLTELELPPSDFVITGQQYITINVIR